MWWSWLLGRRRGTGFSAQNHGDTLLIRMRADQGSFSLKKEKISPEINFKLTLEESSVQHVSRAICTRSGTSFLGQKLHGIKDSAPKPDHLFRIE